LLLWMWMLEFDSSTGCCSGCCCSGCCGCFHSPSFVWLWSPVLLVTGRILLALLLASSGGSVSRCCSCHIILHALLTDDSPHLPQLASQLTRDSLKVDGKKQDRHKDGHHHLLSSPFLSDTSSRSSSRGGRSVRVARCRHLVFYKCMDG